MNGWLSWIFNYVRFFLMFLGFAFLSQKLWSWFKEDSLLHNAVVATIIVMLVDLSRFLIKKLIQKKDK